jgi:alpha-D-xyloside xylohydrolase
MVFERILNLEASGTAVEWTSAGGEEAERRFRLTRPLRGAWRLQLAGADGRFDNRGACQLLADELGEELGEDPLPLSLEAAPDGMATVRAEGAEGRAELLGGPLRAAFVRGETRVEVGELALAEDGMTFGGPLLEDERLWGTGERFDALDQRGKRLTLWAEDRWLETRGNSYCPVPFVLSSRNWGLFVNRFEGMKLDLGAAAHDRWKFEELAAPLDLYVFLDDSPRQILEALTSLSGRPPVPPDWGFGMLVSRHGRTKEFATREGVLEMAAKMDELDLPWSAAIIEGWPTYDSDSYAELKKLAEELHSRGRQVMVYDACGRLRPGHWDKQGAREEYFARSADGAVDIEEASHYNPADAPDRRTSRFLDVTGSDAIRWWSEDVWGRLLGEIGVDGAKIDFCEQFPEHLPLELADGRPGAGMHHYHPTKYNTVMHRLFNARRPDGGLCWSRGGGIGAARYPFMWCGDQLREFRYLKAMLIAALSAGLSGIPFMGHDMSGYMPAKDPEANPEPEVFVRGTQLAAFFPVMSTHGTVTRPYDFETEIVDLYRAWTKIHYALIPYIREEAAASCAGGVPFLRPMCLQFPDDERARGIDDQFMMGESLLVAPILERAESRDVYVPAGSWRSLDSGDVIEGPRELRGCPAPLSRAPAFAAEARPSPALNSCLEEVRRLLPA